MCATGPDQVNPLIPPEGSVIGDRVRLQGYTGIMLSVSCFMFVSSFLCMYRYTLAMSITLVSYYPHAVLKIFRRIQL